MWKNGEMNYLFIAIFGSLGALCRYQCYLWISALKTSGFPLPTLIINLVGCLLAGLLIGYSSRSPDTHIYTLMSVGFIGSFTTFSAFGVETLTLFEQNHFGLALLNVMVNLVGGILLIWLGRTLTAF
jgi:CrcB protein